MIGTYASKRDGVGGRGSTCEQEAGWERLIVVERRWQTNGAPY